MGVELGAAGLGVIEVAPGHEVDAPDAGVGGNRPEGVGVGSGVVGLAAAIARAIARERGRERGRDARSLAPLVSHRNRIVRPADAEA
jgi:hypothetical protein